MLYNGWKVLGLIPARGGSKGVPGKNIRELARRPLIAHTIDCALASGVVDRLICSTDSLEISRVAERYGAEVPFMRPAEYSTDGASGMEVIMHAMEWVDTSDTEKYDCLLFLQPTTPLRRPEDIIGCLKLMKSRDAAVVLSVCEANHPPLWMNTLPEDLCMQNFLRSEAKGIISRQQLPVYYRLNGAVYLCNWEYLDKSGDGLYSDRTYAYIMPKERSVDIDSIFDFQLAEFLIAGYEKGDLGGK